MTIDPGNSNDTEREPPLPLERRKKTQSSQPSTSAGTPQDKAQATTQSRRGPAPDDGTEPESDQEELWQLQTSDTVTQYDAKSAIRSPFQLVRDIYLDFLKGRELAWRLFLRNIRGLYRQTLLGLFWAFLPPIANTAIWIFLRETDVLSLGDTEVNSTVYILTGMILWQAFIDAFQMPLGALNKNKNMISKLNFPRESLLLVGIGEVIFDLLIRLLLLIPAFLIFQVPVHATILLAPFAILGLILLGTSLGLLIMPFGSLYQDVGRFTTMILPFWMILTPIIYTPFSGYPGTLLNWLNPASPLLILSRDWLLLGTTEHLAMGLIFGLCSIPIVLAGLIVYRISIPVLVERMTA